MALTLYEDPVNKSLVGTGGPAGDNNYFKDASGRVGYSVNGGSEGGGSINYLDPGSYTMGQGPAAPQGADRGNAYLGFGADGTPQYRGVQNGMEGFYSGNSFSPVQRSEAAGGLVDKALGFALPAAMAAIGAGGFGYGPLAGADAAFSGAPAAFSAPAGVDPTGISAGDLARGGVGNFTSGALGGASAAAIGLDPTGLSGADIAAGRAGAFNSLAPLQGAVPGVTGAVPGAAPGAPAAPAAPGAPGGAPGAASGLPGASTGGAAGTGAGGSIVDSLIKQMKDNAVGLGLIGASTLLSTRKSPTLPSEQQLAGLSSDAQGVAKQLLGQYQSGALSPGQQASLDQMTQGTKNQLRQYFASIGQSNSTAAAQAEAQVDQTALAMKQQMLDSALQEGLNAIGVASGPLNQIAQYELGQDQQLRSAFGSFAGAIGNLFGRQSGSQTASTSATASPTITSASASAPSSVGAGPG